MVPRAGPGGVLNVQTGPVSRSYIVSRLSDTPLERRGFFDSFSGWSCTVTLFSALTSFKTIQYIYPLLDPGSVRISLGSLLCIPSGIAPELSLEVVDRAFGFEPLSVNERGETLKVAECEYTT